MASAIPPSVPAWGFAALRRSGREEGLSRGALEPVSGTPVPRTPSSLAPTLATFYLVELFVRLSIRSSGSKGRPPRLPSPMSSRGGGGGCPKKPSEARLSRPGKYPMAVPDPHFFSRTENMATNRAGRRAGAGGLRGEEGMLRSPGAPERGQIPAGGRRR